MTDEIMTRRTLPDGTFLGVSTLNANNYLDNYNMIDSVCPPAMVTALVTPAEWSSSCSWDDDSQGGKR